MFPGAFACMLCESLSSEYGNKPHGSTKWVKCKVQTFTKYPLYKLGVVLRGSCRVRDSHTAELNLYCFCTRLTYPTPLSNHSSPQGVPSFTGRMKERDWRGLPNNWATEKINTVEKLLFLMFWGWVPTPSVFSWTPLDPTRNSSGSKKS